MDLYAFQICSESPGKSLQAYVLWSFHSAVYIFCDNYLFLRRHKHSKHVYCLYKFSKLYKNSFTVWTKQTDQHNFDHCLVWSNIKYIIFTLYITVYNVYPKGLQSSDSHNYTKLCNIQNYTRIAMRVLNA